MSAIWIGLSLLVFAALHSLTASVTFKDWVRRRLGHRLADGVYRLAYNVFAAVTFVPPVWLAATLPDGPALWRFPAWLVALTLPVQLAAVAGMFLSLWRVDLPRFIGLRQFWRLFTGRPEPRDPPRLRADGIHAWVRHPLYFFSLVVMWLVPVMTPNYLVLALGLSLYFWIGSTFEERKLVREFGDAYRAHQARVPRLFPWPRPRSPRSDEQLG